MSFAVPRSIPDAPASLRKRIAVCLGAFVLAGVAATAEEAGPDLAGLPEPVGEDQFEALRGQSPFTRSLDPGESILLTGIGTIDGRLVATIVDKETKERSIVSETPNSEGWKVVEIEGNPDLGQVSATISIDGGEVVTVKYDQKQLNPSEGRTGLASVAVPRGEDKRPLPTQEERRKFGEWVKQRMSNFTDEQKRRVGEIMQEKMKANPNLSDRQKGQVFVQILDYVEKNQ